MKKRILIVDDNEPLARLMAWVLRAEGAFEVEVCANPHQAYERAMRARYDLVISDYQMPALKGDMLYLCLSMDPADGRERTARPRLLLISGELDPARLSAAVRLAGDGDYLQKPFEPEALLSKVRELTGEPARPRGARARAALAA